MKTVDMKTSVHPGKKMAIIKFCQLIRHYWQILLSYSSYREGYSSQSIWLDDVKCYDSSTVNCLSVCQSCPSLNSNNDCSHYEDMTLDCGENFILVGAQ